MGNARPQIQEHVNKLKDPIPFQRQRKHPQTFRISGKCGTSPFGFWVSELIIPSFLLCRLFASLQPVVCTKTFDNLSCSISSPWISMPPKLLNIAVEISLKFATTRAREKRQQSWFSKCTCNAILLPDAQMLWPPNRYHRGLVITLIASVCCYTPSKRPC